ncbi:hypothetical protein B566_EDAN000717 [Ephemera danica]|nr:hypothetical protein B566_EDAN000717 [Ephemera danica]
MQVKVSSVVLKGLLKLKSGHFFFKRLLSDTVEVGQKATLTRLITENDVKIFSEVSGDTNPVHTGNQAVVHGAFLNSLVSCIMGTKLPGPGSMVVSQSLKYPNPCMVGETVTVSVIVTGMKADLIKCRYTVMAQLGEEINSSRPVLTGEASLITKQNQQKRAAKNRDQKSST